MQHNQPFVEHLIALKSHYQSIHEEIEREKAHTTEQLTHVNAILIEHLGENQQFVLSLIGLRTHYQGVVGKCVL